MTESEAKQWLKHTRAYQHKCDNCEYIDIKGACNEECKDFYDMAIQAIEEVQAYRAIGTIERFRELSEKAEPKKVVIRKIPKTEWTRAVKQYICPSCDAVISFGGKRYCSGCGQRLDWE